MNKILLILLVSYSLLFGDDLANSEESKTKLIYIKQESNLESQNYVGQIIKVNYNVLVLEDSYIESIGFLNTTQSNMILKNPDSPWNELDDGSLENTFYFKINNSNFYIPSLQIISNKDGIIEKESSKIIEGSAISLDDNHSKYAGVVAQKLEITHYSVKFYDQNNNIIVFDIKASYGNLENLKFKNIQKQGFESTNFEILQSSGIYYVIIPNNIFDFEFEYFELPSQSYKTLHMKNIINKEQISVNQDLNPINKILIFKNIIVFLIICVLLILFFIIKIPFKIRIVGLIIAICLIFYLSITLNRKEYAILKANNAISILPTKNSTIIEKISNDANVQIISSHSNYYKIITSDDKIGWVEKDAIK